MDRFVDVRATPLSLNLFSSHSYLAYSLSLFESVCQCPHLKDTICFLLLECLDDALSLVNCPVENLVLLVILRFKNIAAYVMFHLFGAFALE